jgi:FAD/FMN-containing dehydrogenase/Fe-S oxidoreductase
MKNVRRLAVARVVERPGTSYAGRKERVAVDARALASELRKTLQGEVRFDDGSRALYATDSSNYRQVPIGVVLPKDADDVAATIATCRRFGAPLLPRGGGTSLAGQCCNVAVVLDFSKYMNRVLEVDPDKRIARVQPGTILDDLRHAAEQYHLTYGPDPSTHTHCTLGGMIGNNSCGVHSVMAGMTSDNVETLDIVTYDGQRMRVGAAGEDELARLIAAGGRRGEIHARLHALVERYAPLIRERYPDIPRRVSGYNLVDLLPERGFHVGRGLVGSEGTCATVLEATVRLVESPPGRVVLLLGYPNVATAADHVPEVMAHGPVGLEGFDDLLVDLCRRRRLHPDGLDLLPDGGGWLLVEFGAETREAAAERARSVMETLGGRSGAPTMKLIEDPRQQRLIWLVRESGLGATAVAPDGRHNWEGWEDSAVAPEKFGAYLRDLRALMDRYDYGGSFYGHFGQGCLHTRINFDLESSAGIERFDAFLEDAGDLVIGYGGSVSGEHGDGQARATLLPKMFGPELMQAFREFKAIWDPDGKMNPGKVIDAYRPDENLRLGTDYRPAEPRTRFQFPDDGGSLAHASLRCVGVGKCRRLDGGTMCPSFMVTREEMHSTRGRARLLFEMLQGDALRAGWRDEHVKEALDLCLACKGCKGDCPVKVDMATYKAEFLSHYYAGRIRPMSAYTMGLIYWWARLASLAPGLTNALLGAPALSGAAKAAAGIARGRHMPAFAPQTFKQWFHSRKPVNVGAPQVLLWADTFNNHFRPQTAIAAVEVLEAAGYQVLVPERSLCCGRPLYDFGMLDTAERLLRQILDALRPQIAAGIPVVGLEPSCVAVFRDELINLFPNDEDAQRLSRQAFLLSEFLERHATGYEPPKLARKALVHGHCHHKAVMGMGAQEKLLWKMGLDYTMPEAGCCGMAGSFGFEEDHYDVSIKVGERALLPAVRAADKDILIVADGFSCREQIAQTTDRRALHLAEVLRMGLEQGANPAMQAADYPERAYVAQHPLPGASHRWRTAALATGAVLTVGGTLLARRLRGRRRTKQ